MPLLSLSVTKLACLNLRIRAGIRQRASKLALMQKKFVMDLRYIVTGTGSTRISEESITP